MDNRGTAAPSNSQIRRYFASQNTQDPSICWPFRVRYKYSDIINRLCRVHLSSRRVPENVEAPEPSAVRRNTEGENVVAENHRGTLSTIPIIISSGDEDDSGDDAAYEAAERRRKGKAAVDEFSSGAELEYDRQLNVAILESLKGYNTNIVGQNLNTHALRTVTGLAGGNLGNIVNDSASNPVMELANISHSLNEDSVDEGAQTEALDVVRGYELAVYNGNGARSESEADIGKFINCSRDSDDAGRTISDTKPTDSIPRPLVSRSGRLLKPTYKLLQRPNATDAPAGEGTSGSKRKQSKTRRVNAIIAWERHVPQISVGAVDGSNNATLPSTRKRKDGRSVD